MALPSRSRNVSATANNELIERFYDAFDKHDGDTMAASYTPGARFSDPVFQGLKADEPGAMWRMLTSRATDLEVQLVDHDADEQSGSAHWLADYTFTQTGRRVHNDVHASFRFAGGQISHHRDEFGFHRWARQALGPPGLLLGWTPMLQGKVRGQARAGLDQFMAGDTSAGGSA
jgi:ketosteroid isomerase-like protein